MAGEWSSATLGDTCDFSAGNAFPKSEQGDIVGKYPFIKVSDMNLAGNERFITFANNWISEQAQARLRAKVHPEGATIFAKIGIALTYNRRRILSQPTIIDNNMMAAIPDDGLVHPLFLYYLLCTIDFNDIVVGTALPYLNISDLKRIVIQLPNSKREQQAIACFLGALDDKIELNRRMNRTLEATVMAIFKSWFVDFDPVRARAAGQQPPGLKPEIAAFFPDSFEDSELGEIPKGWRIGKIDDAAYINRWTLGRRDTLEAIDYVEISEVMRGEVGNITRYTRGEEPSRARRRLKHGDTVLSTVRPDRGAHFLVLNPPESLIASTGFAVLTPKDGKWAFLHSAITRSEFGQELGRLADGGAYPAIRPEVVGGRSLVLPSDLRLIGAFDRIAQPLFLRAEVSRNECRLLSAIRDTLLPKLISGELLVSNAERIAGRWT